MIRTPLTVYERLERVRHNVTRFKVPRLHPVVDHHARISICGFGPSLRSTWPQLSSAIVMTSSGAHDFLISKGVIPTYHVETDPREHKVEFVRNSHSDVTYFINSQCHPSMFEALAHRRVVMWHGFTDEDAENQVALVELLEPGTRLMGGGTNVGMRAIVVARELGHTNFDLHGMDCCYSGDDQWAGKHYGPRHPVVKVEVAGRVFETSEVMLQSTDDFFNTMGMMPGCRFCIHGDGLLEERLKMYVRDPRKAMTFGWWKPVDFVVREEP